MINPNDISTVRVDELPPDAISLLDLFPFETVSDQGLKRATFQTLINFIALQSSALQFEVKRMSVTQTYIDDNFDETGLGINICAGFAICNGQNGTENLDGLVGIGFGSNQNNIGGFGGSRDAVVVAHSHLYTQYQLDQEVSDNGSGVRSLNKNNIQTGDFTTTSSGISGAEKNMQPYIVQLYMMKL